MSFSKPINRRKFLGQTAVAAAASTLPLSAMAQHLPTGDIVKRYIPGTHEALPVVGMGATNVFRSYPEEGGKELSQQVLQAMINMGGRLCDTPSPGFNEPDAVDPVFGEMMKDMGGIQNDLFLTNKISTPRSEPGREAGLADAEWAIDYLGKDPIDLLLVHNMKDIENLYPVVQELKAEGRTRYIGVSRTRTTDFTALKDFMRRERPDFILLGYSPFQQEPADQDVMAIAQDLGIALIAAEAFKAGEDGLFFSRVAGVEIPEFAKEIGIESWAQYSLKWILGDPAMTSIVVETSNPHHVVDNMTAAYGEFPDQALRKKMSDFLLNLG
jgi:diketogulonate reductase-like aldo/keto reductase